MSSEKIELRIGNKLNTNLLEMDHTTIQPRAELVFIQTDTHAVECFLQCTPLVAPTTDRVPAAQRMAFQVYMLLAQIGKSGQLNSILNPSDDPEVK